MTQAKESNTVRIHFTGTLEDGSTFTSTRDGDPVEFALGTQTILPALENSIVGMTVGETSTQSFMAAEAFGPFRDDLILEVARTAFPAEEKLEAGERYQSQGIEGGYNIVTIIEVTEEKVVIDANHPLAGKDVTFEIELVEVV